jgi:integrase
MVARQQRKGFVGNTQNERRKGFKMARGKDGLYRRDSILAFRFKDHDGRWREKFTGTTNRQEARDFKKDFEDQQRKGAVPGKMANWRLDQAEGWWNEHRKPRISQATANSERYRLQHFRLLIGNKRLCDVTNSDLDRYQNKRLEAGVGAWSINKEILLWSLILKKAKVWSRLRDDYKPLRTKASDIGRALTREELRTLANNAQSDTDWEAAFYGSVLAANTGLRGGELKGLRISAVDLERRRLIIRRASTKTDAGARYIELNQDATEAARRLLLRADLLGATEPEHYLMPKHLSRVKYGPEKGKRGYDPTQHQGYWDTAWRSLTRAIRCPRCSELQPPAQCCRKQTCKADVRSIRSVTQELRFHDLRHTFITHMVERGVPLGTIQAFVGHMSARMIRHYTHITTGAARRAVELLDQEPMLSPSTLSGAIAEAAGEPINSRIN